MSTLTRRLMRSESERTTYRVLVTPAQWGDNLDSYYARRRDAARALAEDVPWTVQQLLDDGVDPDAIHVQAKVLNATITIERAEAADEVPAQIEYRIVAVHGPRPDSDTAG